ncbi:DNA polymerase type-B family [Teratosphaeria destructans]|uniref:DNA polymerase n=1 Tax=Teratosphaeria destructans TaxID=418781 RepID=A0A9W7STM3_9PEZI|nr:DNA polymerase type-B family [Teratosphaeria destructans]
MANHQSGGGGDTFRVRLNCVDHYQSAPSALDPPLWGSATYSSTQAGKLPQVPVIRVFGATETGQKVCMHIHGAFPYLYVPYTESVDSSTVQSFIGVMRHSIDHALALSYRRNPYDSNPRNSTYVAHVSLVKGVPFFGYDVGYKYFLKIYLLNPSHMTRFTDLLQQGAIMKRIFQPYEAHLQYLLQWMCDFNLYGCAYIESDRPRFRSPVPEWEELEDPAHLWHDRSIDPNTILDEALFPRQSHCMIELDIRVEDILNRHEIKERPLHHSFIERLESLENLPPEEKLVHSMAGLWKDETKRRKLRMGINDPSSSPFPPEVLVSMSADPRNTSEGGWIHEEEFRRMVDELASEEKKARGGSEITFETFGVQSNEDDSVQTVLGSVEELFTSSLAAQKQADIDDDMDGVDGGGLVGLDTAESVAATAALVDMSSIAQIVDDEDYGSDEETARRKALTQRQKLQEAGVQNGLGDAKVDGQATDIERNAEQVAEQSLRPDTAHKVEQGQSLKRTSVFPSQGRFKRAKFDEAQQSSPERPQPDIGKTASSTGSVGRVTDDDGLDDVPPPGAQITLNPQTNGSQKRKLPAGPLNSSSQQLPASSQRSSQGGRLTYPVIKNPNGKDTQPRPCEKQECADLPRKSSQTPGEGQRSANMSFSDFPSDADLEASLKTQSQEDGSRIDPRLTKSYGMAFKLPGNADVFIFGHVPPSFAEVDRKLEPQVIYQDAYYSDERDVPERPREYAGQEFKLESNTLPFLQTFDRDGSVREGKAAAVDRAKDQLEEQRRRRACTLKGWELVRPPPSFSEVKAWLETEMPIAAGDDLDALEVDGPPTASRTVPKRQNRPAPELSQIDGPTQKNRHGFKFSQKKKSTSVQHETGYMSTMSLEVHINSRADLAPDPERDEVTMVVWCISDEQMVEGSVLGITLPDAGGDLTKKVQKAMGARVCVEAEETELDMLNKVVDIVRHYDPDILTGYEVHNSSWGYLIERARLAYEFNLPDEFSRMKSQSHGRFGKEADRWGFTHTSTVRITGRHTINIWRAMRSELNLLQYTMENVVFHLLHRRVPHYKFADLTRWWNSGKPRDLAKVLDYFVTRTRLDLEILDANELIPRTSEQARLLGVDFFSVFSRGSQFKVESLMFRIAKPESFVLVSPSRKQVGAQNALECLPLVMEPQSAFYNSPLLVLDFQSLYPSVMIAYNYCYSTCLGRIVNWRGTNKMGFADFQRTPGLLELAKDHLNIAPNGMMYVKPSMRKSLLAKMLGEILETRVMVKSGMKVDKDDKTLQQLLNNRQLALKLIANVTYGYTSASFSGRMPCSEIADSIVQTGRETLEKAIALIHSVERWGAEVVYGDTDSLFVYLKGRTKDEAFRIGDEIAKAVTDTNPRPIKLKFEKVYHPCVLLAKKRYVGFKYESPKQTEPDFDAKGIETVRRDGTPAEQKIEEKALKLLFRTADLSQVKSYFQKQCTKIMQGRISVQDFCFAKEVKLGTYADKGPPPPGALIATKRMLRDPRTEPQYGERVPYVVIAGGPGARLWERCVEPERLIHDEHAELDAEYYISKNLIPPLERIFNLVGANVRQWYDEMPKVQRIRSLGAPRADADGKGKGRKTMESYMGLVALPRLATLLDLRRKLQKAEKKRRDLHDVCRSCADLAPGEEVRCDSRDCPVFYSRVKADTACGVAESGTGGVLAQFEQEVAERRNDMEW